MTPRAGRRDAGDPDDPDDRAATATGVPALAPGLAMAVIDVTANGNGDAQLFRLATHDGLTGLVTRDELQMFIGRALEPRAPDAGQVVVVFVGLDGAEGVDGRDDHSPGHQVLATDAASTEAPRASVAPTAAANGSSIADDVVRKVSAAWLKLAATPEMLDGWTLRAQPPSAS